VRLGWSPTYEEMDNERSSGADMNGRFEGGPEMMDTEIDISKK
jgi:hypothetical protein